MSERNLTLLTDLYELTMMQGYFHAKDANETVIFDAFYRTNPDGNGFAITAGLEQVVEYIENLHFDKEDIDYLRTTGLFGEDFLEYLSTFKFTGDIYAIPEGTVVFPREPLVKVIAPIMQAQLVETAILNIINSVKEHNTEKTWFDTNGAAGLVFYFALAAVIVLYMSGNALPATIVLTVLFIIPLLLMFFKEPLSAIIEKKAQKMEGGVGMFITQGVFELFEVLLSYFSNTLSFVRVGAFAVSHAAMMQVVLMLAGAEAGSPNWAVVIGGNLFVCGMEGLIVGIQVLRLEYYELFSRFYRGSGRAFEPYGKH